MLIVKFKQCCTECAHRDTLVDESKLYSNEDVVDVITTIHCEHEKVCKAYLEEV